MDLHLNTLEALLVARSLSSSLTDYLPRRITVWRQPTSLEENPLRVLDSKERRQGAVVEQAPPSLDYLDEESCLFDVRRMLEDLGVAYVIDTNMVAWFDYNRTIFEFVMKFEGNELIVCAGGRRRFAEYWSPATAGFDLVSVWNGSSRLEEKVQLLDETGLDAYIVVPEIYVTKQR